MKNNIMIFLLINAPLFSSVNNNNIVRSGKTFLKPENVKTIVEGANGPNDPESTLGWNNFYKNYIDNTAESNAAESKLSDLNLLYNDGYKEYIYDPLEKIYKQSKEKILFNKILYSHTA